MKASRVGATLIGHRYRVEQVLGEGGMGAVYRVYDQVRRESLALKRLKLAGGEAETRREERFAALFEREYQTLVQVAHPRIIEAFDYGVDEQGPYYTMELLDGEDLSTAAPMPWRDACRVLRDIASALALLHSRRLIHRDVAPRNIRCTQDGRAKLIDFGAMMPMGPGALLVGTPPFVPPEALMQQELDGRVDLYALGAILYWLLTSQHAYPARQFSTLRDLWRTPLSKPSNLVKDIPEPLSALALSLLSLDRLARPANAAVVMERLAAIADLESAEELEVSSAYLTTPTLVGRDKILSRVRKTMLSSRRRQGEALILRGASGVGRSRLLDACVLEAKLQGLLVLRVDGASTAGPWAAARHLFGQLIDAQAPLMPIPANTNAADSTAATTAADLSEAFAALVHWVRQRSAAVPADATAQSHRLEMVHALRDWLKEITNSRAVLLAIDDLHNIDEPTAAVLASLADEIGVHALVMVATLAEAETCIAPVAVSVVQKQGHDIEVPALSHEDTELLLKSVFGNVPNVRILAARLHASADGNPRALMELAQHLVDTRALRYEAGLWLLPRELSGLLPEHHQHALLARFETLSANAQRLAETMAICTDEVVSDREIRDLAQLPDLTAQLQALSELEGARVLARRATGHAFSQQAWPELLRKRLEDGGGLALYGRIAMHLRATGGHPYRLGHYLLLAKRDAEALDVVVEGSERALWERGDGNGAGVFLHESGLRSGQASVLFSRCLALCDELERPPRERALLELVFIYGTGAYNLEETKKLLPSVIGRLTRDSGLQDYNESADAPQGERLTRALTAAQKRYEATEEHQRVFTITEAITQLSRLMVNLASQFTQAFDVETVESLPSLAPLEPLSPAIGLARQVVRAARCVSQARHEEALEAYAAAAERLDRPDRAHLAPDVHRASRFGITFAVALIEAGLGLPSALQAARTLEQEPSHQVNAWLARLVYYQTQGDAEQAEQCRARAELLRVQNAPRQYMEDVDLQSRTLNAGHADELIELKRLVDPLTRRAARHPGWRPTLLLAQGEQARILGNHTAALELYEEALTCMRPAMHVQYSTLAGRRVEMLLELGRAHEALEFVAEADELCKSRGIMSFLPLSRSLVEAYMGDIETAAARCEAFCEQCRERGMVGLRLGRAYEMRARIAIVAKDSEAFDRYAALCAAQYRRGNSAALAAKYEALLDAARKDEVVVDKKLYEEARALSTAASGHTDLAQRVDRKLSSSSNATERATQALDMLLAQFGSTRGFLYTLQRDGVLLSAASGDLDPELDERTRDRLQHEIDSHLDSSPVTITAPATTGDRGWSEVSVWSDADGIRYWPLLLHHSQSDTMTITGMAIIGLDLAQQLQPRWDLVHAISRFLQARGDVYSTIIAP